MKEDKTIRPCSLNAYIAAHPELTRFQAQKAWEKWCESYRRYQADNK